MSKIRIFLLAIALAALAVAAGCGSDDDSTSASGDSTSGETVSLSDCTPDTLETKTAGTLTIGTDKPAYPPYFEDDDPTNGQGFESATAYAIADKLGFDAADVKWTVVPFNASFAPGPKDFDFDVNQISITPKREEQVDFSDPYYEAEQAVVVLKDSDLASATTLADLADANIGVQIGTTSLDAVNTTIQPDQRAAGVRQLQRRRLGAQERPGRRDRGRHPDRPVPDRGAGARRRPRSVSSRRPAATRGAR